MEYSYTQEEIKQHIDDYALLTKQAEELKRKIEDEKVYFSQLAERDLADSKVKTKCYYGDTAEITAVTACSVKINRLEPLIRLFGAAYESYVKTETKFDIKDAATKRMLAAMFYGDYIEESSENCIAQMTKNESQRKLLATKLKGANPLTDAENIKTITGCSAEDAAYYASVFAEVKAYEDFVKMVKFAGLISEDTARELIHQGLTVEKTAKVGIKLFEE